MSTTIKRISLVAVAALGLGVLSVAPSNAAPQGDSLATSATTASTTVGTAVTVNATLKFLPEATSDTMSVTASFESFPDGIATSELVWSNIDAVADVDAGSPKVDTATARVAKVGSASAYVTKQMTLKLTPSKAGTYVIKLTPRITDPANLTAVGTAKTWTVTVAAKTIGWKTAFIGVAGNGTTDTATVDTASLTVEGKAATAAKLRIDVGQGYGSVAGAAGETATAADAKEVVVATTKGLVAKSTDYTTALKSVTLAAGTDADSTFWVFSNGDIGEASVTITVGGTLLATKTVKFYGAAKTLVATTATGQPTYVTVSDSQTTTITANDEAGTALSTIPAGLTVASSDTSVATVTMTQNGSSKVVGVKAGDATITVTDPATTGAATAVSYKVHVAPAKAAAAPVISFDKSAYNVGELVTMTISADMGDKTAAALFSAALTTSASVNASGTALPNSGNHALVGGKVTYKFYAPAVSGSFTVTGTTGTDIDLTTAATVTKSIDIVNASVDAATDAANEAAQAASDATDAALAAADAADLATGKAQEALDAVNDLANTVATLIADLKSQIKTLSNLVTKIAKKVKA